MNAALLIRAFALGMFAGLPAAAQQPDTLRHTLHDPNTAPQSGGQQGFSVAVDGGLAVVGSPFEDLGQLDAGVARVYGATGALLQVLANPSPAFRDNFGSSVAASGKLVVVGAPQDDTATSDAGSVYVYDLASATPAVPVATLDNPSPYSGDSFGSAVAASGTLVVVGAYFDDTGADNAGSAYVYDLASPTPTVPVATLNNPSPAVRDTFGFSVAISGTRVVVGAPNQDFGAAAGPGRAFIFDLVSANPAVPVETLNNPSPSAGDFFGSAVAVSGTRVVVGASQDDAGASNAGSAYVYDLASATPTVPIATLNNPGPAADDVFGTSVGISGTRVVVGAHQNDVGAVGAGSAYVYDLASAMPTVPVATLNNPAPANLDNFGYSVAISGTQAIVGAPFDDTVAGTAGSAYVYNLARATPTVPVATLNQTSPASTDQFGSSVAISGTRLVAGAPGNDTGGIDSGSAYVYDLASGTPAVPAAVLENPGPTADDHFGSSVAISGTRVVVGASENDTTTFDAGSAYVYDLVGATPTVPVATLNNPSPASGDKFGASVAISGKRVVVGAYQNDISGAANDAGSVYIYDLASATPTVPVVTLNNPSPAVFDLFGVSVAISGTRVVVGANGDDTGADGAGSAYVYDLAGATPTVPVATLNNPSPAATDNFGRSVAISGTRVVVGAPGDDTGVNGAGIAYLYDLASAAPTVPVLTLNNPSPAENDQFGSAVAVSGKRVVVGAHWDDAGAFRGGSAYVYDLASAMPTLPVATLNNPTPDTFDEFGSSVTLDGITAVVGAYGEDGTTVDRGAAYVFAPANPDFDGDGLLDIWEHARFGSITAHTALDDTDEDGRNELLELAFDSDPTVPGLWAAPAVTREGGFLTMTIAKRGGVSYLVETAGSPDGAAFSAATTTTLINNATTLKVRDNFSPATATERLIRVKVNAAP